MTAPAAARDANVVLAPLRGSELPLHGSPVAVVETSWVGDVTTGRIVWLVVVTIDELGVSVPQHRLTTFVHPSRALSSEAPPGRVPGFQSRDLESALPFQDIAPRLLELVEGRIVCAWNAPLLLGLIRRELGRVRQRQLPWDPLDPSVWAALVDRFERGKQPREVAERHQVFVGPEETRAYTVARLLPVLLRELAKGGHCKVADLRQRAAFARWQRQAALDAEIERVRYLAQRGQQPGQFDLAWHAAEGLQPPEPVMQPTRALRVGGADTSRCGSCGAAIVWVTTQAGRPMPLDPDVLEVVVYDPAEADQDVHRNALEVVVTADGGTVRGWTVPAGVRPDLARVSGRISHFATCPSAGRHRRAS